MVPIDIEALAEHFGVDVDIIFGRLYYHLEKKFGYTQVDKSNVHLHTESGEDTECVNFPLMTSVLAGMHEEHRKHVWAIWIAIGSLVISIASLIVSVLRK
jgi:hypothetical protein